MKITNTTLHNRSKRDRLTAERNIPRHHVANREVANYLLTLDEINAPIANILYSIGVQLLDGWTNSAVCDFLTEYDMDLVNVGEVPRSAFDVLGSAYQYLSTKAESLSKGAFYTGPEVARDLLSGFTFETGETILDPSCGSGVLLLQSDAPPSSLVGIDADPLAVMITKFNYFLKFPDAPSPQIYCDNFFLWFSSNRDRRFTYVVGNPPYGGEVHSSMITSTFIHSGESFSYFTEYGYHLLAAGGVLRYLLPAAALNIPRHADLRDFLLDFANLRRVKRYAQKFSGVMTDIYLVEAGTRSADDVIFEQGGEQTPVSKAFLDDIGRILSPWSLTDMEILAKARARGKHTLVDSVFGLGVVTGDNKTKLLPEPRSNTEPIYTGKEVQRYRLDPPNNHLVFDRAELQQVAPDALYRASEKLVYKVIGVDLRFALDDTASLTTNSANIVIPRVPGYDVASVMALLNSDLYSFLHRKLFGGVNKIAKANLKRLLFPDLTLDERNTLSQLTKGVLAGESDEGLQAFIHEKLFGLSPKEIAHIRNVLSSLGSAKPEYSPADAAAKKGRKSNAAAPADSDGSKRRGRPHKAEVEGIGISEPKRRGRPPKARGESPHVPQATSMEEAIQLLQARGLQRTEGNRQVSLFNEE